MARPKKQAPKDKVYTVSSRYGDCGIILWGDYTDAIPMLEEDIRHHLDFVPLEGLHSRQVWFGEGWAFSYTFRPVLNKERNPKFRERTCRKIETVMVQAAERCGFVVKAAPIEYLLATANRR